MCTAHDNQYTSADELSNLHTVYQNRDTLFWTSAYKKIIPQETFFSLRVNVSSLSELLFTIQANIN